MKTTLHIVLSLFLFAFQLEAAEREVIIHEIPSGGITINLPGTYVFGKDIHWSPSGNGQAILIESDDVTLDLNGYKLISATTPFYTTGIAAEESIVPYARIL